MQRLCEQSIEVAREHVRWMRQNKISALEFLDTLGHPIEQTTGSVTPRTWELVEDSVRRAWQNAIYALERRSRAAGGR